MIDARSAEVDFSVVKPEYDASNDTYIAFEAKVGADVLQVSIGEFPDEARYTLLLNGKKVESFDEWPVGWRLTP